MISWHTYTVQKSNMGQYPIGGIEAGTIFADWTNAQIALEKKIKELEKEISEYEKEHRYTL